MDNRTLISKAAVDTATLGTGGKMSPEQAKQFITFMKDYSGFLRQVNFINMTKTARELDSLEVNKRSMRRQKENQDNLATGAVTTSQRRLDAIGVIMPYDITFQFMKENLEGAGINTTLAKLFAQQFANDTVDLAFNGDETKASDDFLSINNGWLKIALGDAGTHKFDTDASKDYLNTVFPGILSMIPGKYFQLYKDEDKSKIKIFCSHAVNRGYKQQLQERNTALGDSVLVSGKNVTYDGFEIYPVGFLPDNIQIATPFENLAYGIYGQSLEVYHDIVPRKTRHEYTLLADFDMEIVNPDALVIASDLTQEA